MDYALAGTLVQLAGRGSDRLFGGLRIALADCVQRQVNGMTDAAFVRLVARLALEVLSLALKRRRMERNVWHISPF